MSYFSLPKLIVEPNHQWRSPITSRASCDAKKGAKSRPTHFATKSTLNIYFAYRAEKDNLQKVKKHLRTLTDLRTFLQPWLLRASLKLSSSCHQSYFLLSKLVVEELHCDIHCPSNLENNLWYFVIFWDLCCHVWILHVATREEPMTHRWERLHSHLQALRKGKKTLGWVGVKRPKLLVKTYFSVNIA